ncbi:MAG: hypothetical protein QF898_03810 [SAR202 cluster bacterium]|jgi:hypothetical protein|nr:hypothetical protein [SAR202 cluster bacterium]MDP6512748.1 hypothetical protein [SAR202 cluster bacterium]
MVQTYEALVDKEGNLRLVESVELPADRRALVVILDEEPVDGRSETALLSEKSLAEDWNRPEEDEAWSYLQQEQSS